MKEQEFWLTTEDQVDVYVKKWFKKGREPKAIVQLAHGMMEHINRYDEFATFLVKNDIVVYGNDHRGHGKTGAKQGLIGFLAESDGFSKTTNDLYEITKLIKKDYPSVPLFLFGHSMGSFLVREYIQKYSNMVDGVILSGTGYYPSAIIEGGKLLARTLPPKEESHLMDYLSFGQNNRKIKEKKTKFDWLSRDDQSVQAYIDDSQTGFVATARFFYDLMTGLGMIHNTEHNRLIRGDLPMLLISGDADPVGDYSKGIWKTADLYKRAGLNNFSVMLFNDARHELLNELNKEEVYQALYQWIENRLV